MVNNRSVRMVCRREVVLCWLLLGLVGCAGTAESLASVPAPLPAPSTSMVATTSTSTTSTSSTTSTTSTLPTTSPVPMDPTVGDVPDGTCAALTPDSVGYRNLTSTLADQYVPIGSSSQGRTIWSEHWGAATGPQVLVLGQVHGDECAPAFLVQAIRQQPPTDFGIWLVPTVNPDGLAAHTRLTAQGIDPNRDGYNLATPEAQAVMHVTELVQPALTIHLHSPYEWVGAHNGPLARRVAVVLGKAAGWPGSYNAGRVRKGTQAFLWEGQERVLPGAQSVLVEFPATAADEAAHVPKPESRRVATVEEVRAASERMRDALYAVFAAN